MIIQLSWRNDKALWKKDCILVIRGSCFPSQAYEWCIFVQVHQVCSLIDDQRLAYWALKVDLLCVLGKTLLRMTMVLKSYRGIAIHWGHLLSQNENWASEDFLNVLAGSWMRHVVPRTLCITEQKSVSSCSWEWLCCVWTSSHTERVSIINHNIVLQSVGGTVLRKARLSQPQRKTELTLMYRLEHLGKNVQMCQMLVRLTPIYGCSLFEPSTNKCPPKFNVHK